MDNATVFSIVYNAKYAQYLSMLIAVDFLIDGLFGYFLVFVLREP